MKTAKFIVLENFLLYSKTPIAYINSLKVNIDYSAIDLPPCNSIASLGVSSTVMTDLLVWERH